jgi:hypothetical protein
VEEGQVEGNEPHLAAAGLDTADYGLVFFWEARGRVVGVWETHFEGRMAVNESGCWRSLLQDGNCEARPFRNESPERREKTALSPPPHPSVGAAECRSSIQMPEFDRRIIDDCSQ